MNMLNKSKIVFVDESGDEGRKDGKSSDYYVVLALIIDEDQYEPLLSHFKKVRGDNFQHAAEMKSSTVGNNTNRRKKIVSEITSQQFSLSVLVIDKTKLTSPGFYFSPSFVKYMHSRLYRNIKDDFHYVKIQADRIKSHRFMVEFEGYIQKNNPKTLFSECTFDFVDSKSNEFIQAADFLAGTLRRCVERKETKENIDIFLSHFKHRSYIELFPYSDLSCFYAPEGHERTTYDLRIERRAVEEAARFLNENKNSTDTEVREKYHCLQILFSDYYFNEGKEWISSKELKEKLEEVIGDSVSDQKLRLIIGGLRDNHVLIVSRKQGGYKLPTQEAELYEYLNVQSMTIVPMISRISQAHQLVKRATEGKVDILEKDEYIKLRYLVDAASQAEIAG